MELEPQYTFIASVAEYASEPHNMQAVVMKLISVREAKQELGASMGKPRSGPKASVRQGPFSCKEQP